MSTTHSILTTLEQATRGYDREHELALLHAIGRAIVETSRVSDCDAIVLRTGEAVGALLTVLAAMLAMSPSFARSPTALRKNMDELHRRLRRSVNNAEADPELSDFIRRAFRSSDVGGHA